MDSEFIRGHRIQNDFWDDNWQMPFSEEEFDKIVSRFLCDKEKIKNDGKNLIYVSSARLCQTLKNKGDIIYEV